MFGGEEVFVERGGGVGREKVGEEMEGVREVVVKVGEGGKAGGDGNEGLRG